EREARSIRREPPPAAKYADLTAPPLTVDVDPSESRNHPRLERPHEGPHVAAAARQVEHDIGDPLAWTMIGEAPAASGLEHWEAVRRDQLGWICARAGRVEGRVLQQPDAFTRSSEGDCRGSLLHESDGLRIGDRSIPPHPSHPIRAFHTPR